MKKFKKILAIISVAGVILICNSTNYSLDASTGYNYDVNEDGSVTVLDMTHLLRYLNGSITANDISVFDVDNNGIISYKDYQLLIDYLRTQL